MRVVVLLAAVITAAACGSAADPFGERACPEPSGEFPPTDCALVQGRVLSPQGAPLAGVGVRVDSMFRPIGYAYVSGGVTTDSRGGFRLTVMRVDRFKPPATPDTATVEIKLYRRTAPPPGATPFAAVAVRMRFAPLGAPVEPTDANLTITPP
jgi:hypothetical protein